MKSDQVMEVSNILHLTVLFFVRVQGGRERVRTTERKGEKEMNSKIEENNKISDQFVEVPDLLGYILHLAIHLHVMEKENKIER